jgi:HemY protein
MRRVLAVLVVGALAVGLAWAISLLHGHVSFELGSLSVETSTPVALAALGLGFVVLYAIVRLLGMLLRLPQGWRAWRARRHRALGDEAVTQALVALAAGEGTAARRDAARARRLLGDTPQTLLLAGEAARLAERENEADAVFRLLAARKDAAFLGLRGLFRLAMGRQDFPAASALARQAEAARPGGRWLRGERTRLALRIGDWSAALALTEANAPKAALAAAAANAAHDEAAALRLAQQAWKADPSLAPAALAYAARLRAAGKERRALAVIRQSWALAPRADLAEFALAQAGAPMDRLLAAQRLAEANPDHVESRLLLARASLAAGLTGEARRHAEAAREAGLDQRRLWVLLAEIEGDGEAGRQALRHAVVAAPDPRWRCTSCGAEQAAWQPVCPACGTVGGLR